MNNEPKNETGYFGIIPAHVRYHKSLTAGAKVLYADFSALTRMNGWCEATDKELAELYEASESSIQRRLQELENRDLLERRYNRKTHRRYIRCIFYPKIDTFAAEHF